MPIVRIDGRRITDWNTFHSVFSDAFGFPSFYGRNMDAWIDCMTYLDDPDAGMSSVHGTTCDPVVLQIDHIDDVHQCDSAMYERIVDCSAFVNWRRIEKGDPPILLLSYYRNSA
jgi:RNAse (barnase) inhibitor barstar